MIDNLDPRQRLIVALDVSTAEAARKIVAAVGDSAHAYKVGMQLYTAEGPVHRPRVGGFRTPRISRPEISRYSEYRRQPPSARPPQLGVSMLTVHASGGGKMLRAADEAAVAARADRPDLLVLAVTVLTSLDETNSARSGCAEEWSSKS